MKLFSRRRGLRRGGRTRMSRVLVAAAAVAALAAPAAACGSSGAQDGAAQPGQVAPTAMQVLTEVERGDLTESVVAPVRIAAGDDDQVVEATVPVESAAAVAEGQTARVMVLTGAGGDLPQGAPSGMPQPGQSGMPQPGASGMPQGPPPSGVPQPGQSGVPQPGASGMPQPGQGGIAGGLPGGDIGDRGTPGTVTAVEANADGTVTATIRLDEALEDAGAGTRGFAAIETKLLAADVIVIPTAALTGSGSSATVEVMADGTTETRTVQVGRQSGSRSEIVSGLSEGENIVWYRSFPGAGASGGGQGQASGAGQAGGGTQ